MKKLTKRGCMGSQKNDISFTEFCEAMDVPRKLSDAEISYYQGMANTTPKQRARYALAQRRSEKQELRDSIFFYKQVSQLLFGG